MNYSSAYNYIIHARLYSFLTIRWKFELQVCAAIGNQTRPTQAPRFVRDSWGGLNEVGPNRAGPEGADGDT